MKWILLPVLGLVISQAGLVAQTVAKRAAKPKSSQASVPSDQEKNIRAYIELLRTDVRKQKAQITSVVMQLDAEQSAAFWPIYKDFETDLAKIGEGTVALIKTYADNYESMTDQVADELATKILALEQQRNEIKRTYYQKFKGALGALTAARFLQVENQLERVIDLQIASELPVIGDSQQ